MNDDCTHGDDYLFSPPGSDELHCGLCLLARVAALESVIAAVKSWEAAERAACAASDGLASCEDCHDDGMPTSLRAVLKRGPR
jgi:hypothetical protein